MVSKRYARKNYAECPGCGRRIVSRGRRGKVKTALARAMERHMAKCPKC